MTRLVPDVDVHLETWGDGETKLGSSSGFHGRLVMEYQISLRGEFQTFAMRCIGKF